MMAVTVDETRGGPPSIAPLFEIVDSMTILGPLVQKLLRDMLREAYDKGTDEGFDAGFECGKTAADVG